LALEDRKLLFELVPQLFIGVAIGKENARHESPLVNDCLMYRSGRLAQALWPSFHRDVI
jgi:hypothetical protein